MKSSPTRRASRRFALTLFGLLLLGLLLAFAIPRLQPRHPPVMVNWPEGAQPLTQLPTASVADSDRVVTLNGERAVLWWTVYKYTLSRGAFSSTAIRAADAAVDKAYPKVP